jgi:glutamate-1-semialdehyde aminotransferase
MGCKGIHCPGCGDGGGGGIAAVVIVLVLAVVASAKAIGHALAEVGHVLVLVAIAGASVTVAAGAVILGLVIRHRLRQVERATDRMRTTLSGYTVRELPEPKAEIPAKIYIYPPADRERVGR